MRVLHVSEVSWGGVVSLLRLFTAEQSRRGHDVALLAPPRFPSLAGVRRTRWSLDRRRPTSIPRATAQLYAAIHRERPDVVHLHSAVAGVLGRLPLMTAGAGVPLVYQPHAWSFELYDDNRFRRVLRKWEGFAARRTDVLVANCGDELAEGRHLGITAPGYTVGVALDTERFHPVDASAHRDLKRVLGLRARWAVVCIGRLARQKGQDLLVSAWEARPLPETELVLAGPGDPRGLAALAPTQWGRTIKWVGEQQDVRPWLWAGDLLVLPSRYETVGVVVAEAMGCGRPVVANRVNGVDHAVVEGPLPPAGTVVATGAMDDLLKECQRRLEDPQLHTEESAAALVRAAAMFTPHAVVDRLDQAYEKAVAAVSA